MFECINMINTIKMFINFHIKIKKIHFDGFLL